MSISIAEAILQGANKLRKAGVPEARREAGSLLAHILEQDRSFILAHADSEVTGDEMERFLKDLEMRAAGKPLQYITGHQEFYGLDFEVTTDVLIPRPETELLVETALKVIEEMSSLSICDVGTGSGCVAIALVHNNPRARVKAIDISPAALEVARKNAVRHAVSERIDFVLSDCFASADQTETPFDLIVSNPPYVSDSAIEGLQREVRDFEPRLALEAGADGLAIIRRLLTESPALVKRGGYLLFEIGFDQHELVKELIDDQVWKLLDIHKDLQGIPRIVALQRRD